MILIFVTVVGLGGQQQITFGGQYATPQTCQRAGELITKDVPATRFYCILAYDR